MKQIVAGPVLIDAKPEVKAHHPVMTRHRDETSPCDSVKVETVLAKLAGMLGRAP